MDEIKPKVYMITNGTSPLGQAIALGLAGSGATVIMVARHNSSGEEAAKEIALATQNPNLELQLSDLANLFFCTQPGGDHQLQILQARCFDQQ